MRVLLLVLLVSAICCVSCTQNKFGQRSTQPAYPIGSAEFSNATPPRFHDLTTGMSEQAVLSVVGEPTSESDIYRDFPYDHRHCDGAPFDVHCRLSTGRVKRRLRRFVVPRNESHRRRTVVRERTRLCARILGA